MWSMEMLLWGQTYGRKAPLLMKHNGMQCSVVQCIKCSLVQCISVQCRSVQCITALFSTAQCSAV